MTPAWLDAVLQPGSMLRQIDPGVWSALPEATPGQAYDRRAANYDRLIGNSLYNRFAWGCTPADYSDFARRAASGGDGLPLDAGCGSLVSTAAVHVASGRPTVLVDLSLGMLAAARRRLRDFAGEVPAHLTLVQADVGALPFRNGAFGAVLCPGLLHLIENFEAMTSELARVAAAGAPLFLSSLIAGRRIGPAYLGALYRAGEVARPRTAEMLAARLRASRLQPSAPMTIERRGNMAFVSIGKG